MTAIESLIIVVIAAAFSGLCYRVACRRGEDAFLWSLTGALLGPFVLPLLLIPPRRPGGRGSADGGAADGPRG
jgi:hypothetical protein